MAECEAARAKALSLVGQGYIYGAKGQVCSTAFRQGQAAQYPEQAANILGIGARWDGVPVWDCAQLTRAVARAAGVTLVSGATSQWNKTMWARKGTIDTLPPGEACFVYRRQGGGAATGSTVMAHTGVALGDGTCVHARGTAYGVVRQDMGGYAWTHWASPWEAGITQDMGGDEAMDSAGYQAEVVAETGSTVNVREEPNGALRSRLPLGTVVDVLSEADGWCAIAHGGGVGYMQSGFLRRVDSGEEDAVSVHLPETLRFWGVQTVQITRADALKLMVALNAATARE